MDRSKEKNQSDGMQLISDVVIDESPLSIPESLLEEAGINRELIWTWSAGKGASQLQKLMSRIFWCQRLS